MNTIIKDIYARQILDSRGMPTIETEVILESGHKGVAKVPSGASTGLYEAVELRDCDEKNYFGKSVNKAVDNVNKIIAKHLKGANAFDIKNIDKQLIELDQTKNKSKLGANAILSVSLACVRAVANAIDIPLYRFIGGICSDNIPTPMMNILNGGAHADNGLDSQEFMIVPNRNINYHEALRMCVEVFHTLKQLLKERGYRTSVGDEGGFAPNLSSDEDALELIIEAIKEAHYIPGKDFYIAIDAASSEWKGKTKGNYFLPKSNKSINTAELIEHWTSLCEKYPICSIEDPLDEEDFEGWKELTDLLGKRIQLVGDDLFVTNPERLMIGIKGNFANAILIKPNQIGTITETLKCIEIAKKNGYKIIISHRSGETDDDFISDLAVAVNSDYIKAGAPSRGERVAKYNRLIILAEEINK